MNKCYIIIYDLMAPGKNYELLYNTIKSYGTWGKITESCWIIVTSLPATAIRDRLSLCIDRNDRLFVSRLAMPAAWRNTKADDVWVKRILETYGL